MTRCPRCQRPAVLVNGAWVCTNPQCPGPGQPTIPGFPGARELHGLRRGVHAGPERLLCTLILRGLRTEHRPAAAALVLALDAQAADHDDTSGEDTQ